MNLFRKKVKVSEGVRLTPTQFIAQRYIDAYMDAANANILFRHGTANSSAIIFPDPPDIEIPIPMKIDPCAYCGSRCVADYRGNCRACGAPKGH